MNLKSFEETLAGLADNALSNAHPTGGFAGFLSRSPAFALLWTLAVSSAHSALVRVETPAGK